MKTSDLVRIERKLDTISRLHKFGGICKVYRFFEAERFGNPAGLISQLIAVRFRKLASIITKKKEGEAWQKKKQ